MTKKEYLVKRIERYIKNIDDKGVDRFTKDELVVLVSNLYLLLDSIKDFLSK